MSTCRWGDSTTDIAGPKTVPLTHLFGHESLVSKKVMEVEVLLEDNAWMFSKLTPSEQEQVIGLIGTIEAGIKCCSASISEDLINYEKIAGKYKTNITELNYTDRMITSTSRSLSIRRTSAMMGDNDIRSNKLKEHCSLNAYLMLVAGSEMQRVGKSYPIIANSADAIKSITDDFEYLTKRIINLPNAKDISATLDFISARLYGKVGLSNWVSENDFDWFRTAATKLSDVSSVAIKTYLPWQNVVEFKHFDYGDKVNAAIRAESIRKASSVFNIDASVLSRCGPTVLPEYIACLEQFFKVFLMLATNAFCLSELSSQCLSVSLKQKELFDEVLTAISDIEVCDD